MHRSAYGWMHVRAEIPNARAWIQTAVVSGSARSQAAVSGSRWQRAVEGDSKQWLAAVSGNRR